MKQVAFFLGANTPRGFQPCPSPLLDPMEARAIYLIKGGPGCGKSTLMKTLAARGEELGHRVEYYYCSGDPNSLDAVVFPDLQVSLADATAPHVMEPSLPGVTEHYVNLEPCYDAAALAPYKEEIARLNRAYQTQYRRAYRCLRGAGQLGEDTLELLENEELKHKMQKRAKGIISREIPKDGPGAKVTERFLNAVSCKGELCLFPTVDKLCKRVYELADTYGTGHLLLEELLGAAVERGWSAIVCPDPMAPGNLRHLLLPDLSLAFVTGTPAQPYPGKPCRRLRLDSMLSKEVVRTNKARLRFSRKVAAVLRAEGVETLAQAKALHDQLEGVYNPHVDFDRVGREADRLWEEIFG